MILTGLVLCVAVIALVIAVGYMRKPGGFLHRRGILKGRINFDEIRASAQQNILKTLNSSDLPFVRKFLGEKKITEKLSRLLEK